MKQNKKTAKIYPEDHKEIMKEIAGTPVTVADYIKMLREDYDKLKIKVNKFVTEEVSNELNNY